MFKDGSYVYYVSNDLRYVHHIVGSNDTHYFVQVPYFVCWGSTFARWSPVKKLTKKYLDKKSQVMPTELASRYATIEKGESTSVLFKD